MIEALTTSADDTRSFAAAVAGAVQPRDIVLLAGDLGAGKTTFAQGFGAGLGVDEQITSPTFVLLRSYKASLTLHHADIYRLDHLQGVIDLGLFEMLDDGGVALVEWGDLATPVMPRDFLEIRLSADRQDEEHRSIHIRGVGQHWSAREKIVADAAEAWAVAGESQ